jgi:chemotaxis regulatin CheY-phosphate phosphatase CheZ
MQIFSQRNDATAELSLAEINKRLDELRCFVSRRFDEVSFEINATSQMVDMNETNMIARFSEILAVLNAISFSGQGKTAHNAGVELDAVVKTTEDAANRILDAASEISQLTRESLNWSDEAARSKRLEAINKQADDILAACAFQDLTGQRIGRTLENIRKAEEDLAETLRQMGIKLDCSAIKAAAMVDHTKNAQSQSDIDALFN